MSEQEIEDYIQGRLQGQALKDFEEALKNDSELAQEVAFQLGVREALHAGKHQQTLEYLREIEKEHPLSESSQRRIWWVAASVLVILSVSLYWVLKTPNHQQLYLAYYTTPMQLEVDRQRGETNEPSALETAYLNYDKKNFSEALIGFEQALGQEPNNSTLRFFAAICQMELQHFEEAEKVFLQVPANSSYYESAQWYLSLCLLQLDKPNEAEKLLVPLSSTQSAYQEEARALLEKLR